MSFTFAFMVVGTAIGLVRALPQLVRLVRTRDPHGVSVDTAATSSVVSMGWAAYGHLTGQSAVALASASSAVMFALVTIVALRLGRSPRELRAAPVWLLVLIAATAIGATGLGVVLPVSVLVANVPQLWVAWREPDLTGLSLGTWLLSFFEAVVWGAYGLVSRDPTLIVHSTLYLITSGGIIALRLAKGAQRG
jgi:uncharacterized protein with PQ loop repeat